MALLALTLPVSIVGVFGLAVFALIAQAIASDSAKDNTSSSDMVEVFQNLPSAKFGDPWVREMESMDRF